MLPKGVLAVYKPRGPTSHDVINRLRRLTGEQRIGHAGTLDPLARGVLVVGVGREATKKLGEIKSQEKEYVADVRLGMESTTGDEEGEKREVLPNRLPSREEVEEAARKFVGETKQVPPVYSAVKVGGKAAYRYARAGKILELSARKVLIKKIEILSYQWPILKLRVVTGPGVYVRALARDLGKALGTAGYLTGLERVRVGEFTKEKAFSLEEADIDNLAGYML